MTFPHVGGQQATTTESVPDGLTLSAFNTDCSDAALDTLAGTLAQYLDIEDVTTGSTVTDAQPDEFLTLHNGVLIDGTLVHSEREQEDIEATASMFKPTDTIFFSGYHDHERLRALSQRVEKRAWQAGAGNLYTVGQQRLSTMDDHWGLYASIAGQGTEVHVYEDESYVPGDTDQFTIHQETDGLAGTWLVAFDGDGNDAAKGLLLVEERDPDQYFGVWTVEPDLVDEVLSQAVGHSDVADPTE
ncbi:hypothetical protein [Halorussus halophilus]|uniref:hypothetical protein n=1 Tax=Halorussus halophilus TaxID=2650975 RepID=UPI00130158C1|nr:hypothetical protein [Halorussus halophilus]